MGRRDSSAPSRFACMPALVAMVPPGSSQDAAGLLSAARWKTQRGCTAWTNRSTWSWWSRSTWWVVTDADNSA